MSAGLGDFVLVEKIAESFTLSWWVGADVLRVEVCDGARTRGGAQASPRVSRRQACGRPYLQNKSFLAS